MFRGGGLTAEQRSFLSREYGPELQKHMEFLRGKYRFNTMRGCFFVLLAAAIYWEDISKITLFDIKPFTIVSWCYGVLFILGQVGGWVLIWVKTNSYLVDPEHGRIAVFASRIGMAPPLLKLYFWASGLLAMVLVTMMTDQPLLAMTWITATAINYSHLVWLNRRAVRALGAMETR